ncbi:MULTISPECIES: aldehyde dehydrogenase family protein [Brevibacillus]|jgi:acyl-CoA reductase-like NAD-dependent aldehyde dehydrogenase|uniref:Aldehyde dehydrogenase n=1 Tax=Brevibacillus parabrevis TaxID=54914 RepID=A0A4Y3PGJ7_BREPA|nr:MULTISPECIES: aldehyde dehydrogenase family protein [Brevibacillus]MBU8713323.1 aldehyde dehydrogenase family protein [Brevibacillus parabrevis]MDH6351650.1 acyl-CoA reductase-like NAD-dependent aldehyde dehydrogenase [Brevibacillus sp. 1238]MDR4997519.1 aldehyde dehydrogenase family protein [Brevibacillus parabrevis]MED2255820.1 aldehyde dehydrogenase family protein [Brevibacillus parabrevis]NRQ55192.1 aldehyde dehydrogenase family protein [Brevibacillus sp. HD1.4A]
MKKHLYINGQWKEANEYAPLYSPYSGELLAEIAQADEADVDEAIRAAAAAAKTMAKLPASQRALILEKAVAIMEARKEELAVILAQEAAKPLRTGRVEIARTIQTYKFAAEEAKRIHGETVPLDAAPGGEGRLAFTVRKPIGVVGAITPFNFPFNLVAHKVGPAIAAGNTVVLKPASQTPLSSLVLADIFAEAGLPEGALNILPGKGAVVGEKLVSDSRIAAITFTGSPAVGIAMKNKAGLKRVTLELGSNSAVIIDQTVEITQALVDRCVVGAFSFSGQVCISLQRVYIHQSKYEEFLDKFKTATEKLVLGDPLQEATDMSSVISAKDHERMGAWVQEAVQAGAQVVTGGKAVNERLFAPTILTNVSAHSSVSCQEVFGPIVVVTPFEAIGEAIEAVNDSRFGLQAGIYTSDIHAAMRAAEELEVGGVMINDIPTFRVDNMPYGGVKDSGFGREGIKYAVEEMTELKLIAIKL